MEFTIEDEDLENFMQLVFMGIEVININEYACPVNDETENYNRIFEYIFAQYATAKEHKVVKALTDEQYNFYCNLMEEVCDDYLSKFKTATITFYLAKYLAEKYYPDSNINDIMAFRHNMALETYYEFLEKNKLKDIDIIGPTIEKRLNKFMQKIL